MLEGVFYDMYRFGKRVYDFVNYYISVSGIFVKFIIYKCE